MTTFVIELPGIQIMETWKGKILQPLLGHFNLFEIGLSSISNALN